MQIHCFQTDTAWESPASNFERIEQLVHTRAKEGSLAGSLLVFPELSCVGFSMDVKAIGEASDGPTARFFSSLARKQSCYVIAGLAGCDPETGKGLNEAVCYSPLGDEISRYRKMHPFPLADEGEHYLAGDEVVVFEIEGWKVAPFICYDLRFPESFRGAVLNGAELFVVIANWPNLREDHWITLLRARAIENQAYVAGVNRCGEDPQLQYSGASLVCDPQGHILSRAGSAREVISASLERDHLDSWRRDFPALADAKLSVE